MAIGRPFAKGQSGFPAGRTKEQRAREKDVAEAICGLAGPKWSRYLGRMDQIIMTGEDKDSIAMLKLALERGLGKPTEHVVHEEPDALTPEQVDEEERLIALERIAKMTPDERLRLLAGAASETVQ